MRRPAFFVLAAIVILTAALCIKVSTSTAVIDGSAKAQSYSAIIFPNITTADTLEAIRIRRLHGEITFQITVSSRRNSGVMAAGDTVGYYVLGSVDDSSYVNVTPETSSTTYITEIGTYSYTYGFTKSRPFIKFAVPLCEAGDSLTVRVKAYISVGEVR